MFWEGVTEIIIQQRELEMKHFKEGDMQHNLLQLEVKWL
jgi:hypothetical protein